MRPGDEAQVGHEGQVFFSSPWPHAPNPLGGNMPFEFRLIDPIIRTREDAEAAKRRAICLQFGFYEPGYLARFGAWDVSHTTEGAEIALYADTVQFDELLHPYRGVRFQLMVSRDTSPLNRFDVSKAIRLFGIPCGSPWRLLNDAISFEWPSQP